MIRGIAFAAVLTAGLIAGPGAAAATAMPVVAPASHTIVLSDTNQGDGNRNGCPPGTVPNPVLGDCCTPGVAHCPLG